MDSDSLALDSTTEELAMHLSLLVVVSPDSEMTVASMHGAQAILGAGLHGGVELAPDSMEVELVTDSVAYGNSR
jgi:hypothetical protein